MYYLYLIDLFFMLKKCIVVILDFLSFNQNFYCVVLIMFFSLQVRSMNPKVYLNAVREYNKHLFNYILWFYITFRQNYLKTSI